MFTPHILVYLSLSLASLSALAIAEPSNHKSSKNKAESDYETFQRLLAQADPPSLHAALHDYSPRFKHGMFREDKSAVEVIHRDDASLATSIIKLAKRQDNVNGTFTSTTPPTESPTPTVDLTTLQTSITPGPTDSTSESEPSIPNTESTASPDSATLPASITLTSTELAPETTSNVPSPASSAESPLRSAGSVYTFTDSSGVIVITTVGGEASTIGTVAPSSSTIASDSDSSVSSRASVPSKPASKSSLVVRTTTLPDGSKSTVTAVTVVPGDDDSPTPSGEAGAGSSTRTRTAAPGVQTGSAARTGSLATGMLFTIGGIAGVAILL